MCFSIFMVQVFYGGSKFLWNVVILLPNHKALYPRRLWPEHTTENNTNLMQLIGLILSLAMNYINQ